MPISRDQKKTYIGPGQVRYRVVVTGDPCLAGSHEAKILFYMMLQQIANEPHLLQCGFSVPQRVSITHNGTSWQVEAEAESEEIESE